MAIDEKLLRLQYIQDFLRSRKGRGAGFREIKDYLERKFEEKDLAQPKFSERTFLRDKHTIERVSGIKISYSRSGDAYYISDEELTNAQESVLDNLLLVEAYRQAKSNSDIMIFEPRKSRSLNLLSGIIHAIQNRKVLTFTYEKYWTKEKFHRVVEPYALKEFLHRWYLLANDFKGETFFVKTFALDRISNLEIKSATFKRQPYDPKASFENSFGIIAPNNVEPQTIVLAFDRHQANYIKSLPLHHSQKLVKEEQNRIFFEYFVVPTYDFKQEILSHGSRVEVVSPASFRKEIIEELQQVTQIYKII